MWVHILDDTIVEPNEQINFDLVDPTNGARLGISAYTLTIIDNDSPSSGIDETDLTNGIKLYPNPVTNTFFLETEIDLSSVVITDLTGNAVLELYEIYIGKTPVDVSVLSAGMYLINVRSSEGVFSKRLVKAN